MKYMQMKDVKLQDSGGGEIGGIDGWGKSHEEVKGQRSAHTQCNMITGRKARNAGMIEICGAMIILFYQL